MFYTLDTDSSKAKWNSEFKVKDKWTGQFYVNAKSSKRDFNGLYSNEAPVAELAAPTAVVTKDSIVNGQRQLSVHFASVRKDATSLTIEFKQDNQVKDVIIQGNPVELDGSLKSQLIDYRGSDENGLDVIFEFTNTAKLQMDVTDGSLGLPVFKGFDMVYPKNVIPAQGKTSNTTEVTKHFQF